MTTVEALIKRLRRSYRAHVHPRMKQKYVCPDCGWTMETRAYRIRCDGCGSLNLERELSDRRLIKADADEAAPENAHLIHPRSIGLGGGTM